MTRTQLADRIARRANVSKAEARRVLAAIFDVAETENGDGSLIVPGLGTVTRVHRRNGKRPAHSADEDDDVITPEEAEIRRELVAALRGMQGVEIEDVFPSGWADEQMATWTEEQKARWAAGLTEEQLAEWENE